ncbi:MAG: hypothetical protein D6730_24530 [Bacteroidetes bacterium]|nr:MAG: hypothetical protein D6730_24530 [Bacteroidota bacterium]
MKTDPAANVFPLCYCPPIAWFAAAVQQPQLLLEVQQPYKKQTYSSRMYIKTSQGVMPLVIPVQRRGSLQPLQQKRISYQEKWQRHHWRSLRAAYGSAPFYEHYAPLLRPLYERQWEFLPEFLLHALHLLLGMLKISLPLSTTTHYQPAGHYRHDYRQAFEPRRQQLPSWFIPLEYPQLFGPFEANLSILDLLFNEGPNALPILKASLAD